MLLECQFSACFSIFLFTISLFLRLWAVFSLIVTERGAEDAERAEGISRSAGERCAAGTRSRGKPHWQISGGSALESESFHNILMWQRHSSTLTLPFSFAGIQELPCTVWNEEKADGSAAAASPQRREAVRGPSSGQAGVGPRVCQGNWTANFYIAWRIYDKPHRKDFFWQWIVPKLKRTWGWMIHFPFSVISLYYFLCSKIVLPQWRCHSERNDTQGSSHHRTDRVEWDGSAQTRG